MTLQVPSLLRQIDKREMQYWEPVGGWREPTHRILLSESHFSISLTYSVLAELLAMHPDLLLPNKVSLVMAQFSLYM